MLGSQSKLAEESNPIQEEPSWKTLAFVENQLNAWLKPDINAEKFDQVGLLIQPKFPPKSSKRISKIFLCNDLTSDVLDEAIEVKADLIISYHPPIFGHFTPESYNPRFSRIGVDTATRCYNHNISLYSPHTSLDSVCGGLNDSFIWELAGFETNPTPVNPSSPTTNSFLEGIRLQCSLDEARNIFQSASSKDFMVGFEIPSLKSGIGEIDVTGLNIDVGEGNPKSCAKDEIGLRIYADSNSKHKVEDVVKGQLEFTRIPPFIPGSGRILNFDIPLDFSQLVKRTKEILNLKVVQVYFSGREKVRSLVFAVGSGAFFTKDAPVDVLITGEICHTNILECMESKKSLIVCGHTDSERPFLPKLAVALKILINCPSIYISKVDRSPLVLM